MSETVERVARALHDACLEPVEPWGCDVDAEMNAAARAALESLRDPDPHVIARAADRLGIPPSDASRLVGIWAILVEEMLK